MDNPNKRDEINYVLMLRLNMLRRELLPQISFKELQAAMFRGKWKNVLPVHTSEAVRDIMETPAEEIVTLLSHLALVEGGRTDINDYYDLLGGNIK